MQQPIIQNTALKSASTVRRAEDAAESDDWKKNAPPPPVTQKKPTEALQKRKNLSAVNKKKGVGSISAANAVQEAAAVTAMDEGGEYLPPGVKLAIQRTYAPAEDEVYEFCRPSGRTENFDDDMLFSLWADALKTRRNDPRLHALLAEEQHARALLRDYRNAMVMECR